MDVAYNQHSHAARRKNRSSTNLNHLSLAPLTSRLPIHDQDDYDVNPVSAPPHTTSYLQGKSAPTTPRLLSRSPGGGAARRSTSRSRGTSAPAARDGLPKSKSTTFLMGTGRGGSTNGARRNGTGKDYPSTAAQDSDWLLRAGALIATETRESKGQAWLVSRASSTSLAGMHAEPEDDEDDDFSGKEGGEHERKWAASAPGTRRNSTAALLSSLDDHHHHPHHHHHTHGHYARYSPSHSRFGSRSHSRAMTPGERRQQGGMVGEDDYFAATSSTTAGTPAAAAAEDDPSSAAAAAAAAAAAIPGPDFVNLDEKLEAMQQLDMDGSGDGADDEAYVRRLVKRGNAAGGVGSWFGSVFGVRLFSVEEDEEEDEEVEEGEDEDEDELGSDGGGGDAEAAEPEGTGGDKGGARRPSAQDRRSSSLRRLQQLQELTPAVDTARIPPPKPDEGGWHDAAWLLTVASKVLL